MSDQFKGNAEVLSETKAEGAKDDGVITCDVALCSAASGRKRPGPVADTAT